MSRRNTREPGYWIVTAVVAALFAVPGVALVARSPHFASEMARLGYPPHFLTILGVLKILGALVIVAPRLRRLKEWAYAGMMFDALGAVLSRMAVGDPLVMLIGPLIVGALVLLSWALRPATRKLSIASSPPQNPEGAPS